MGGQPLVHVRLTTGEFLLDSRSRTEAELLWNGAYDSDEVRFLRSATPDNGVFMDIGANVGMILIQLISTSSLERAIAIEPIRVNFDRLQAAVNMTGSPIRCDLLNVALGQDEGQIELVKEGGDSVSDNAVVAAAGEVGEQVELTRLDRVVEQLELGRLDTIKIDVEGFEAHVFRGGASTVQRFRPVVYGEFNNQLMPRLGTSFRDVWAVFADLDYVACGFRDASTLVVHQDPAPGLGNAALVPRERMDDLRHKGYVFD